MSDRKLVYSTDPKEMEKQSKKVVPNWNPSSVCLKMRLETKSRGGKAVTGLGGNVEVSVPYTLKAGETPKKITNNMTITCTSILLNEVPAALFVS